MPRPLYIDLVSISCHAPSLDRTRRKKMYRNITKKKERKSLNPVRCFVHALRMISRWSCPGVLFGKYHGLDWKFLFSISHNNRSQKFDSTHFFVEILKTSGNGVDLIFIRTSGPPGASRPENYFGALLIFTLRW